MSKRDYRRLSIEEFGEHLLSSGDLDPVYIALYSMGLNGERLNRWLLAYWCFYHCGVASYLSDFSGEEFWDQMFVAVKNTDQTPIGGRWPRGSERRHFRGAQGYNSIQSMYYDYPDNPEKIVSDIIGPLNKTPLEFKHVAERVKNLKGFGDWISFKVCDMLERVCAVPINFDKAAVFMFKDPVKAAIMLWESRNNHVGKVKPKEGPIIDAVVQYLINHFKEFKAPPKFERTVNLQEIETILCKWKSHMNGHYPLMNDTHEIIKGTTPWASVSRTAELFLENMPNV